MPVKSLTFDRHINLVKGVFHDIVRVQLIDPANGNIHVGLKWLGKEQKLRPRQRLEALQSEVLALEHFNAGGWDARSWYRGKPSSDGMYTGSERTNSASFQEESMASTIPMKGSCEDQVVVDGEFIKTSVEVALVDEPTSSIDDDECEDDPWRSISISSGRDGVIYLHCGTSLDAKSTVFWLGLCLNMTLTASWYEEGRSLHC